MAERHIYLVRHGETYGNRSLVHQAKSATLTERGITQAKAIAKALGKNPIGLIITSGATRAQQTVLPLIEMVRCPAVNNPLFEELRRPSSLIGKSYFNPRVLWILARVYLHIANTHWRHTDEETFVEFQQRVQDAVELLESQEVEYIVVVSHRVFMSSMLAVISGAATGGVIAFLRDAFRFRKITNGSITELSYDSEREMPWHIISTNDTRHLRNL